MMMEFRALMPATFGRRDNRFRVQVWVDGHPEKAHLPNSGRLGELLVRGRNVWLVPVDLNLHPHRSTAYDLVLVEFAGGLVSIDARVPGRLVGEALCRGQLEGFEDYSTMRREVRLGRSRIDFHLEAESNRPPCWIEVKSVTLVEDGTALFPDAPTLRGKRHLRELMDVAQQGERAAVMFVVQRDDAQRFAPHAEADPAFALTLHKAALGGVEVHAWRCNVTQEAIRLAEDIPVTL